MITTDKATELTADDRENLRMAHMHHALLIDNAHDKD